MRFAAEVEAILAGLTESRFVGVNHPRVTFRLPIKRVFLDRFRSRSCSTSTTMSFPSLLWTRYARDPVFGADVSHADAERPRILGAESAGDGDAELHDL